MCFAENNLRKKSRDTGETWSKPPVESYFIFKLLAAVYLKLLSEKLIDAF
jgi:hypothetical protein